MRLSQFSQLALLHGLDDWVSLRELGGFWTYDDIYDPVRQRDCALLLARELLTTRMADIGETGDAGYTAWTGDIDELIERAVANGPHHTSNQWGLDVWFRNTPAGDERGRQARNELDRRLWCWDES